MSENFEIERKFLISIPDFDNLDVKRKLSIIQTYLISKNDCQRRVRSISENGETKYFYTEKVFLSAVVRKENENEITKDEYERLLSERNRDFAVIKKTRVCFEYEKQLFEVDVYPFSDVFAIMELELENPEQKIIMPENVEVLKEVTGINEYSNASLANNGKFPCESEY